MSTEALREAANVFLRGKLVYLRPPCLQDFTEHMPRYTTDRAVVRHLVRGTYPMTIEQGRLEYERTIDNREDIQFAVCELTGDRFLGIAGLHTVNYVARHGEFRILLGAKDCWGRGYGTEALRLVVAYAFELVNLNKVWLGVNTANTRAYRSYEKGGFVLEGTLRAEVYRNGRYYDVARFSLLRPEYDQLKCAWEIAPLISEQLQP